jgi:hypothetical protein
MTPCSDVVGYQSIRRPCCLHLESEEGESITTLYQNTEYDLILHRHENLESRIKKFNLTFIK